MHRFFFALAIAIATVSGARAGHPLITEDTGTQGAGRWQLEVSGEDGRDRASRTRLGRYDAVLSHGVAGNADLQLGLPWLRHADVGAGDVSFDLKWRFHEQNALSLGLKPGVTLPSGDERRGLGAGRAGWGTLLILSYAPGPLAFHAHAGYKRNRNALGECESLTHFSGALVWKAAQNLKLVADYARDTNSGPAGDGAARYAIIGAIWSVTPDFDLDLGLKTGHGGATLDRALMLGMALRW